MRAVVPVYDQRNLLWVSSLLAVEETTSDPTILQKTQTKQAVRESEISCEIHVGVFFISCLTWREVSLQVHHWRGGRLILCAGGGWGVACGRGALRLGFRLSISWLCAPLWTHRQRQVDLYCFLSLLIFTDYRSDHVWLNVSSTRTALVCSTHIYTDEVRLRF